jgi:crotonobetainyl-CoA:carnitine CoA-transferase CaiB-like acyl-CoA transferase
LWSEAGLPLDALDSVELTGADPVLPSSFALGEAAQATIAASALAAAEVWSRRNGDRQIASVDMRHAAMEFLSERFVHVEGKLAEELWDPIAGAYECGDGRFVRLHTNFPHHRDGLLRILRCANEREAVAKALRGWKAFDLEDAAAAAGLCATAMRSIEEWDAHPQGQAVMTRPVVSISRIGDGPVVRFLKAARPLADVRVLDLTRVIAGPVCGRTLAAHGAEVLTIASPNLPNLPALHMDTSRGKRSAFLDLREPAGKDQLRALLAGADVFVQGYRPGGLAALGFGPEDAAAIRPGIIYVSLSAYGSAGPWAGRRGFDSLTQTASGMNHAEAEAAGTIGPRPLPCQALDHASGYLLAFGALVALLRRMDRGGSWHVAVSLARTGHWIRDLGRVADGFRVKTPTAEDAAGLMETSETAFGTLHAVRHAAILRDTPAQWALPSPPIGADPPTWTQSFH